MDRIFNDWKKLLSDFKDSVEKDLKEIRRNKAEVQMMRTQMLNDISGGRYIHDDNRIVISAPEIIIGNVDRDGVLMDNAPSIIIINGKDVRLNAAGDGGTIVTKASSIRQYAVDPGIDGEEDAVNTVSEIVSQARNVIIQANDEQDAFSSPLAGPGGGVKIHADNSLILDASVKNATKKKELSSAISSLEKIKSDLKTQADSYKKEFESMISDFEKLLDKHEELLESETTARAHIGDIIENNTDTWEMTQPLFTLFKEYSRTISRLAEVTRKINAFKSQKDKIKSEDEYKKKSTGSNIIIKAENVGIQSIDGEGNIRDNEGAGVTISGKNINMLSLDKDGGLMENGGVSMVGKTLTLSTVNSKNIKIDDSSKQTGGEYEAIGDVFIKSKNVAIEGIDSEFKDSKQEEKSLTKDGKLSVRFETVDVSTNDTEGKAVGSVSVNSKSIDIKSMDVDKEKRTDKSLSQGSTIVLLSEKMFIGGKDKDTESKLVQTSSESIGSFAKNTFEVQQGEKKSVIQMDGGKMSMLGDSTEIFGKTTINDATEVKGELKAPKASIDNLEAKSSFKSPNISDGMAVGGGGGGGSLSVKLTKEVAPKKEASQNN